MPISIEADPTLAQGYLKVNGVTAATVTSTGLTTASLQDAAVTPAKLSQPYTVATAQNSTSGTSINFTGIPSWAKRITVMFNGVSTNGTSPVLAQLGTSAGVQATGYNCNIFTVTGSVASTTPFTTGFAILGSTAASARVGQIVITNITANTWVAAMSSFALTTDVGAGQGAVALSGTLDRVRITTLNGTDTFDAGTINIAYEG
jgi:hypothetical protein